MRDWVEEWEARLVRWLLPVCGLGLLLMTACLGPLKMRRDRPLMWTKGADGVYRYEDQDLAVSLQVTADRHFHWTFRNKAFLPMSMDQGRMALYRAGDQTPYSLWGEKMGAEPSEAFVTVAPGGFVKQAYPVRFTSPFYPLVVKEAGTRLHLRVTWGGRGYDYDLLFPVEEPEEEAPADE